MSNLRLLSSLTFAVVFAQLYAHYDCWAQGRGPAAVVVFEAYEDSVSPTQEFVGSIVPEKRALIGSAVDGRIVEFAVNEGDRIESGGTLAQLLTETITKEIEAAEAELDLRQQELAELKNGSRPEEIQQAVAQVKAATAMQVLAERKLSRLQRLMRTASAASEGDVDEARAQLDQAQAMIQERTAAQELVNAGPRKEKIAQAEARVAIQEAVTEKLKDQLTKHTIISRFSGYVVSEHTEEGAWVNRGDPVAEVVALDNVDVLVHVLESYIVHVKRGMKIQVRIPSLAGVSSKSIPEFFQGEVVHIVPEADQRSRTFPVKVRVKNVIEGGTPIINSGMLARVELPTGPEQKSLLIPKDSLVLSGARSVVWIVDLSASENAQGGTARQVPVQTGITSGILVEVMSDQIKPGTLVVSEGNERLQPGADVKILRTMPRPEKSIRED